MLSFVPLNKGVIITQLEFLDWINTWSSYEHRKLMEPEEWFVEDHVIVGYGVNADGIRASLLRSGFFVWSPRAVMENMAVEELRRARHKRQSSFHIFICPKRLKHRCIGQLHKAADLVMEIRARKPYWNKNQHESLIIGVFFTFLPCNPW